MISGTLKWSFNNRSKHNEYPWMASPGERWDWSHVPSWQTASHLIPWPLPRTLWAELRERQQRQEVKAGRVEKAERVARNRQCFKKTRAQARKANSAPRRVLLYKLLAREAKR